MDLRRYTDDITVVDRIAMGMAQIHRLRERTFGHFQAKSKVALDPPIFLCLGKLIANGPMRSGALADAVCSDPSTVSRQVATLVERGWVRREADPSDGRISLLAVTDLGRTVVAEGRARRNWLMEKVMTGWSADERDQFADLLERFVDGYDKHRQDFIAAVEQTDWSALTEKKQNGDTA